MLKPVSVKPPSSQLLGQPSGSTPMPPSERKPPKLDGTSAFVVGSSVPLQVSVPPDSCHGDSVVPPSTTSVSDPGTKVALAGTTSLTLNSSSGPVFETSI